MKVSPRTRNARISRSCASYMNEKDKEKIRIEDLTPNKRIYTRDSNTKQRKKYPKMFKNTLKLGKKTLKKKKIRKS